jgi:ribonuclease E
MTLRAVDIEAGKNGAGSVNLRLCTAVALYILNHKRDYLQRLLAQRGLNVVILIAASLGQGEHSVERTETNEDFVPEERPEAFVDLDDDFDDSAYADEDEDGEEFIAEDDEPAPDGEGADDDQSRERHEGEGAGRRGRRRRGGRRDGAETSTDEAATVATPAAGEEDDDSESGRRRRRGRRGGRRVREEGGERDGFNWVRGRTPSLEDPYVWFDPINPERNETRGGPAVTVGAAEDIAAIGGERPEDESGGERTGRSRRRRGRGRGRDRGGEQGLPHEVKVETRATNEGMPPDGSPDTPMAVVVDDSADPAPVAIAEEPKRRRVRRKVSASATEESASEPTSRIEPNEIEPAGEPAVLDVAPAEVVADTDAARVAESTPTPEPEIDVAALIAEDPNQIVAPPEKPKRGWWRR